MTQEPRERDRGRTHPVPGGDLLQHATHTAGRHVFAGEQLAAGQWRPDHGADAPALAVIECAVGERRAMQRMQLDLVRHQWRTTLQQVELRRGKVRHAEVPHLARRAQLVERSRHLVGIHQWIGTMQQQHIQIVRAQQAQRFLGARDDVQRRAVVVLDPVRRARGMAQPNAALAHQLHALSHARRQRQRLAEQLFHPIATVDVGVIETGDTEIETPLHPRQPFGRAPRPIGQAPHASDDRRQGVLTGRRRNVHTFGHSGMIMVESAWASERTEVYSSLSSADCRHGFAVRRVTRIRYADGRDVGHGCADHGR